MRSTVQKLLLAVVQTDSLAELTDGTWRTRCLHCRSALFVTNEGVATNAATLEHIIPRSWFEKRLAADLRNLALACPRCNQGKGHGHDRAGPSDQRAREVVSALYAKRQARFVAAKSD